MTPAERKAERAEHKRLRDAREVRMDRVDLHFDLSPSKAQKMHASLEPILEELRGGGGGSFTQLGIDMRDVSKIYIVLGRGQMEDLVARLAEVAGRRPRKRKS
jgi:hypothetical protein